MPGLLHGGDYNPEQWLDRPDILEEDIRLMKLAHVNNVSLGIFSWAFLEPEEGKYDFSFWDEFLALAAEENMKVVFLHAYSNTAGMAV